jgi:hypothetical protein
VGGVGVAAGEEVVDEDAHSGILVICIVLEGWGGFGGLRFSARGGRYLLSVVECRVSLAVVRRVVRVRCLLGSVWASAFEWGCVVVQGVPLSKKICSGWCCLGIDGQCERASARWSIR